MASVNTDRIDGLTTSVAIKAPVRVATTANITLSATQTIDGIAVVADDRVLVKNQTTTTENGLYLCKASTWARSADADGNRDLTQGTLVAVKVGTVNAKTIWRQTTAGSGSDGTLTIGTDSPAFELAEIFTANAANIRWNFDSSVSMADPGTGDIRLNNATLADVTSIALSASTGDVGNPDFSDYVTTWDDSTNTALYGTIVIKKLGAPQNYAIYSVTGTVTDNTTWLQFTVAYVTSSGSFADADKLAVSFARTGDKGAAGTGDVVGPASVTDGRFALFDSTTGKLIKEHTGAPGTAAVEAVATGGSGDLMRVDGTPTGSGASLTNVTHAYVVTHTTDTALATKAAGGSQLGSTISAVTIPASGAVRLTLLEYEVDETGGAAGGGASLALDVGGTLVWPVSDTAAGTEADIQFMSANTSVASRYVRVGSIVAVTPLMIVFDVVAWALPTGSQDVKIYAGDEAGGTTGALTLTGTTVTTRVLVEIIDYLN